MTNIPRYPAGNDIAALKANKRARAGAPDGIAASAAAACLAGFVTYLVACFVGAGVSSTAPGGDTNAAGAVWMYPVYSAWIWGPPILLALVLAIVAKARKSPRPALSTTVIVLCAAFPVLGVLVLVVEFYIFLITAG
jgi:hypothetical protein